jgi:hypothetical protein
MDEAHQGEEKALRVEGHGGVIGGQVVFGYPPKNRDAGAIQGVHKIGGTPSKSQKETNLSSTLKDLQLLRRKGIVATVSNFYHSQLNKFVETVVIPRRSD